MVILPDMITWIDKSGILKEILNKLEPKEPSLTSASIRQIIDEYAQRLLASTQLITVRLDEERLKQLAGGLSQLRDAERSRASQSLIAHALEIFHVIAALPMDGKTGDFQNRELISLAYLGMATAHQLLGDPSSLIAEKIIQAIQSDPDTSARFLGTRITRTYPTNMKTWND